jgi:hypothetical protein
MGAAPSGYVLKDCGYIKDDGSGPYAFDTAGDAFLIAGSSLPTSGTAGITSAQTNATGTNWTAFASQACSQLDLVNISGTTIEYRRNATGTAMPIPTGSSRLVIGITNANQVDIRRVDQSNTQVTVNAEYFA